MNKKIVILVLLVFLMPLANAYSVSEFLQDFRTTLNGFAVQGFDGSDPGTPVDPGDPGDIVELPEDPECVESWSCSSWSECIENERTRQCIDLNNCGTTNNKPDESQLCIPNECNDGTELGQCSINKPYYCNNGNLIENCNVCGCPSDYSCEINSCISNVDGEETENQQILNLPPIVQRISKINALVEETFTITISSVDFEGNPVILYFPNQENTYSNEYLTCNLNQNLLSCNAVKSGETSINVIASDGIDETAATVNVNIISRIPEESDVVGGLFNTKPIANAGNDITTFPNREIILDASLSYDEENNIGQNGYKWYLNNELIGSEETISLKLERGEYQVKLVVTDFEGLSSEDTITIKVIEKTVCRQTQTTYFPEDTICEKEWPSNEGEEIKINSISKSCDLFEVCSQSLDPIVEDAIKCSSNKITDNSKINACNYAKRYGSNAKSIQALYIIKSMGRSAIYLKDYYDAEMCCKGVEELCPSPNYLYKAEPLPQNLIGRGLRCANTPGDNPSGVWLSSTNLQLNNIALSEVPTHASTNVLKTGTCVDYSAAITTLLRKIGYKEDEVYTVESSNHAYNLVKFPLERYYTVVDMTGNNEGIKPGKVPVGYDYCESIINCYNDNGRATCPLNDEINGCIGKKQNPSRSVENVGSEVILTFKDIWEKVKFEIER